MRDWPDKPISRYPTAVFLDRDGTINVDTHYPHRAEELRFHPASLDGLRRIGGLPAHVIVVSNQAGIAHGLFTEAEMSAFNAELRRRVGEAGGRIDAFYFCPHKEPHELAPGEEGCPCSKPNPGMLLEAAEDFGIDLEKSVLIGDKCSDIRAGRAVGCATVLVRTGKAGSERGKADCVADRVVEDLGGAARELQSRYASVAGAVR